MIEWKPWDTAYHLPTGRKVKLRSRFRNVHGSYKWVVNDSFVNETVYEVDLTSVPWQADTEIAIPTLAENQARIAAKAKALRDARTPPIEPKEPANHVGRGWPRDEASFEAIGEGVVRWCRQAPNNRRVTLEAQGDLMLAEVESNPSRVRARVVFTHPETVEGVMVTLDRALMKAAGHPYSPTADTLEFP